MYVCYNACSYTQYTKHISAVTFPVFYHPTCHYWSTVRQLVIIIFALEKLAASEYLQTLKPKLYAINMVVKCSTQNCLFYFILMSWGFKHYMMIVLVHYKVMFIGPK